MRCSCTSGGQLTERQGCAPAAINYFMVREIEVCRWIHIVLIDDKYDCKMIELEKVALGTQSMVENLLFWLSAVALQVRVVERDGIVMQREQLLIFTC